MRFVSDWYTFLFFLVSALYPANYISISDSELFLELELLPSVERSIVEWHAENRSGAHGTHSYTPEQFGLTATQLRSDFGPYIRHFSIEVDC